MKHSTALKEIIVKANEESLNSAISEHHIEPENIISVIFQPANHLAIGDYEAKYRVIYRT
jgi:chorismate mutase